MKETLVKQIETYSNGILIFIVLQGLTYSFYFGSNRMFNCLIRSDGHLLAGIVTGFAIVLTILSIVSIIYLSNKMAALVPEYKETIGHTIKWGKIVIVFIFGLFPAFLTYYYGFLGKAPNLCAKLCV